MLSINSVNEYLFTLGILVALVGTIVSAAISRKQIAAVLKGSGINLKYIIAAIAVAGLFLTAELAIVKPTQLLFFDDTIYQAGAVDMLHMGQAWLCDYGTPQTCYTGEIFHEPIATSLLLAAGFGLFGVHLSVAYNTMLVVTFLAVLMSFLVGTVLLEDPLAGLFGELLVGLSPIVLVWARPTSSDMPMLLFSLVSIFMLLIFIKKKTIFTFMGVLLSLALVTYTKVDAILYIPVIFLLYLVLDRGPKLKLLRKNILNTSVLLVVLAFAISILPEMIYTYAQFTTGNYGYQGAYLQESCVANQPTITASSSLGLRNFEANFCTNVLYWLDTYKSDYVMQPISFTVLAVLGLAVMITRKRRQALALVIWFGAFFLLYTFFYAGSVTFGVDWRFMLAVAAPAGILGGYFVSLPFLRGRFRKKKLVMAARLAGSAAILVIIFYSLYSLGPLLGVQPSQIQQAGSARFYENFVYNNSKSIPSQCLVFSYDPTFFIINNRTAAQMAYLYPSSYQNYKQQYSCLVLDWGYWCYTPNNICNYVNSTFTLQSIANATYSEPYAGKQTFGFYYITGLKNSTTGG